MSDWAREYKRARERAICEARGITSQQLSALYEARRHWHNSLGADLGALRTLLLNGSRINQDRGNEGKTLLMEAARYGRDEALTDLMSQGADVNLQDMYGFTALMWAAVSGSTVCVRLLLEAGADPHVESESTTSKLCSALSLSDRFGHPEVRAEIERFLAAQ